MNIHHKISSRAKASGIEFEEINLNGEPIGVTAIHDDSGCQISHADPKHALAMCLTLKMISIEYPAVLVSQDKLADGLTGIAYTFIAQANVGGKLKTIHTFEARNAEDLKDACYDAIHNAQEAGVETETDEDEEEKPTSSVVPVRYRELYRRVSDGTNCGDWLATTLNESCKDGIGKRAPFKIDVFHHILMLNGVNLTGAWVTNRNNGWQGRYRMTGRNMLTKIVAGTGILLVGHPETPDDVKELTAPQAWIERNARTTK